MTHYLNRERMRVVERNDRGNVVYRKGYKFGDEVDVDHLEDGRLDALVSDGTLVESKDDLKERRRGLVPIAGSQVTGAATGEARDHSEIAPDEGEGTDPGVADDGQTDEDSEPVDEYSSMDYATLQSTAKSRDLNAGGSADDLRARLREDDES